MRQAELFPVEFSHRSRGRIHYRKFSINEKINWKSYWFVDANYSEQERWRMYWAYNTLMLIDFPEESINESQQPMI